MNAPQGRADDRPPSPPPPVEGTCPACGAETVQQQCKVFCPRCRRLVFNCSEF